MALELGVKRRGKRVQLYFDSLDVDFVRAIDGRTFESSNANVTFRRFDGGSQFFRVGRELSVFIGEGSIALDDDEYDELVDALARAKSAWQRDDDDDDSRAPIERVFI